MRAATIDRQAVRLPNASTLGYGKWRAQYGDLITFREGEQTRTGRVAGRVAYAPPLTGQYAAPAVKNHLYVIAFGDDLTHAFVRWVDPADVITCIQVTADVGAFAAFLLAPQLPADLPDLVMYGCGANLAKEDHIFRPAAERIERRRQDRKDRGIAIGRDGLVAGMRY